MKYFNSLESIDINENTVVTIGSFDGLHQGHEQIFSDLIALSEKHQLKSVVISFYPHPAEVIANKRIPLLTLPHEKKELMKQKGVDYFIVLPFTKELSQIEYFDFVESILIKRLKMKYLVVGYDHALGKNRQGTYNNLHKLSETLKFGIAKVEPVKVGNHITSSTLIRQLILDGELAKANYILGRHFNILGTVIEGDSRGRTLGYPTANIALRDTRKILPKNGVYFVKVNVENMDYYGMCNIGFNPTFATNEKRIEVHIFDFNTSIYGKEINVSFKKHLRDEVAFENKEALKKQLNHDEEICRSLINNT